MNTLADRIRERLAVVRKSAAAASLEAGLGRSAVQDILSGNSASPRLDTLVKLTGPLQCSIHFLVGDATKDEGIWKPSYDNTRDVRLETVIRSIESGVFREDWPDSWEQREAEAAQGFRPAYPVADDQRLPDHSVKLFELQDGSMEGAGILPGDILHVATHSSGQIDLFPGQIVLIQHRLQAAELSEWAVRQVHATEGGFILAPCQERGKFASYQIELATYGVENTYRIDDGTIIIEGCVSAIYRQLATMRDGKIIHHT